MQIDSFKYQIQISKANSQIRQVYRKHKVVNTVALIFVEAKLLALQVHPSRFPLKCHLPALQKPCKMA